MKPRGELPDVLELEVAEPFSVEAISERASLVEHASMLPTDPDPGKWP